MKPLQRFEGTDTTRFEEQFHVRRPTSVYTCTLYAEFFDGNTSKDTYVNGIDCRIGSPGFQDIYVIFGAERSLKPTTIGFMKVSKTLMGPACAESVVLVGVTTSFGSLAFWGFNMPGKKGPGAPRSEYVVPSTRSKKTHSYA